MPRIAAAVLWVATILIATAPASARSFFFDYRSETLLQTTGTIAKGDSVVMVGALPARQTPVGNSLRFTAAASSVQISVAWAVKTRIRVVGLNVDLTTAAGTVLASDSFQGLLGEVAISTLAFTGLQTNKVYEIRLTATQDGVGSYFVAAEFR